MGDFLNSDINTVPGSGVAYQMTNEGSKHNTGNPNMNPYIKN